MPKWHKSRKDILTEWGSSNRMIWTEAETKAFIDICVHAKKEWRMASRNWGSKGYDYLVSKMGSLGYRFTHNQLKNKWDSLQKDWKAWTWLKSKQPDLGWDKHRRTIIAGEDWWQQAIRVQKHVNKFRVMGLDAELEEKYEELFSNRVSLENLAIKPICSVLSYITDDEDVEDNHIDPTLEEGSCDLDEDLRHLGMFEPDQVSQSNGDFTMSEQKKDQADTCSDQVKSRMKDSGRKSQGQIISERLHTLSNILKATAESRLKVLTEIIGDKPGCSIKEVMEDIQQLQGLTTDDQVCADACSFMEEQSNREMYTVQPNPEAKLAFLQTLSQERQKERATQVLPQQFASNLVLDVSTPQNMHPSFSPSDPNFQLGVCLQG